jgi:hypothetical protein
MSLFVKSQEGRRHSDIGFGDPKLNFHPIVCTLAIFYFAVSQSAYSEKLNTMSCKSKRLYFF